MRLLLTLFIFTLISCSHIRHANETHFWKHATYKAEKWQDNAYVESLGCTFKTDKKPNTYAVFYDHLQDANPWDFPIMGLYEKESGTVWYSKDDMEILLHEYIHHITIDNDLNCLREMLAAEVMNSYYLEDKARRLESRMREIRSRPR